MGRGLRLETARAARLCASRISDGERHRSVSSGAGGSAAASAAAAVRAATLRIVATMVAGDA